MGWDEAICGGSFCAQESSGWVVEFFQALELQIPGIFDCVAMHKKARFIQLLLLGIYCVVNMIESYYKICPGTIHQVVMVLLVERKLCENG